MTSLQHGRGLLLVAFMAVLASCAGTSDGVDVRPSLAPVSGADRREVARDPAEEIDSRSSGEVPERLDQSVDLRTILAAVFERNPRIRMARSEWKAAVEKVPQATALPDPTLTVLSYIENVETRVGPMERAITFAQKIPFPGKLGSAGDVAAEGARIAGLRYSIAVRDALVATKTAYFEYVYLTRAESLVTDNLSIARRLAGLGETMYAEDKALLIDVLKAQSQLAQLEYDLITLTELISAERTRLNALMDRSPEAPLGAPQEVPFSRIVISGDRLYELAATHRQELKIADHAIEQARAREALAESRYLPDITIGGTYIAVGRNRSGMTPQRDSGKDAYGVMVGVTIPLWTNRISAGVREARASREAATDGRSEAWNQTVTSVKDALVRLTNAERLVLLYRDSLIPQAKQVMLSAEESARENRLRLGDYLETQTVWLNFTLAMERALTDYNQAIARLERLTGTTVVPAGDGSER